MKQEIEKLEKYLAKLKSKYEESLKPVFEIGKWYKDIKNKYLVCCVNPYENYGSGKFGYGFNTLGTWTKELGHDNSIVEATESEVLKALKDEAIYRGFKKGVVFYSALWNDGTIGDSKDINWSFDLEKNTLYMNGRNGIIFHNGKWAEIIKDKTSDEWAREFWSNYNGSLEDFLNKNSLQITKKP